MTNAEAWFNNSLRPWKPEGSLGRTAQDVHLDSHTAPELWELMWSLVCLNGNYLSPRHLIYIYIYVSVRITRSGKKLPEVTIQNYVSWFRPISQCQTQTTDPVPKHKQLAMMSWTNDTLTGARAFYSLFTFCTLILQCGGYFAFLKETNASHQLQKISIKIKMSIFRLYYVRNCGPVFHSWSQDLFCFVLFARIQFLNVRVKMVLVCLEGTLHDWRDV